MHAVSGGHAKISNMNGSMGRATVLLLGVLLLGFLLAVSMPRAVDAAQKDADAMCTPVTVDQCGCHQIYVKNKGCQGSANMHQCACWDTTSGMTAASGLCVQQFKCLATQAGGMMPMLPMIPMIPMMMEMPQDPCSQQNAGTTSTSTSPCYGGFGDYYNPGTSYDPWSAFDESTTSDSGKSLIDQLKQTTTGTGGTQNANPIITPTTTARLTGSIKVGDAGASVLANLREGVSEVAGFFGGSTFGGASGQSVAGRLCSSRPWARGGALAKIIPDAFFDTLCSKAGYQVGVNTPAASSPAASTTKKSSTTKTSTSTQAEPKKPVDLGPVEIDIWAEPASVRLGTRTYVFWKSKGVLDCTVTGPNFTQSTLSGGASTVPISGPTTYSLSCSKPDGTKATDSVTVKLAL